jgi:hypothetical protein
MPEDSPDDAPHETNDPEDPGSVATSWRRALYVALGALGLALGSLLLAVS